MVRRGKRMLRTKNNGELRLSNVDETVELVGWVAKRRNFGAIVFIDLRDRYGLTQLVFNEVLADKIKDVRNEYILKIKGIVKARESVNPNLPTGDIEVIVNEVELINSANTTPIIIADETDALEDTRLKYRYLDLRRPVMQQKLITRHKITKIMRNFLDDLDFVEIETPILTKSTPEGARDYLVPSRVHPGQFYALPQSPQLFKQLLMVSGFERYYQVARCFRDEDLRADRQLDFTQVDIEASFLSDIEIQTMIEEMVKKVMKDGLGLDVTTPFLRIPYQEAMDVYGSDKPDNRFELTLNNLNSIFANSEFKVFSDGLANNKSIKGIVVNNHNPSRKVIDSYTELCKKYGAKGLVWLKVVENNFEGGSAKFISENEKEALFEELNLINGDLLLIVCDDWSITCDSLGALRLEIAKELSLIDNSVFSYLWVTDFPLFEYSAEDNRYYAKHHPFTRPNIQSIDELKSNPSNVKAFAYDLVLNGNEIAGGSLRIYDQEMQTVMFEALGFTKEEIEERFGFFIDAFQYGTPPHGGIAFGLDRFAMVLTNSDSIRDVIAFPKNANAKCPLSDAPGFVEEKQLKELHLEIIK